MDKKIDLPLAARHLEDAKTSILDAISLMGKGTGDLPAWASVAKQLGDIATELRKPMLLGAMSVPIIERKGAAAALASGNPSASKLVGLTKARAALAEKRKIAKERQAICQRTAPYSTSAAA